jgi:dipeptidyl aminopeptidase/acylaminoacyl peptidase
MKTPLRTTWTLLVIAALFLGCRTVPEQAKVVGPATAAPAPQATPTPPPAAPLPAPKAPPAPAPQPAPQRAPQPAAPPAAPVAPPAISAGSPAPSTAPAPAPPTATAPAPPAATASPAPAPQTTPAPRTALATAAVPQYTIEQFLGTINFGGASFSPDAKKILVGSNQTGVYNAYAIPVAGGAPVPLTHSTTDNVRPVGYFPTDERFLYLADRGGNELDHLYVQLPDGTARDLTPGDKLKADFLDWAQDDRSFFASTNERDARYFDVYEYQVEGYGRKLIYKDETGLAFAAITPDRSVIAFAKSGGSAADSDIYLDDTKSGKLTNLTPHEGDVINTPYAFSPDGKALYYGTNRGAEFTYLVRYDLATGKTDEVLRPNWDVTSAYFSHDGRYFVVTINNDARTEVRLFATQGMKPIQLPALPQADVTSLRFSRDGRLLAFYADTSRSPRNLYVGDLESGRYRQLTRSLNPAIDPAALVEGKVVRFKSYDGVEIPGILYSPHQASAENRVPALVFVHGGPGDQSRLGYSALIQYLVNHGYVVYAINNRGSSGYGKTFFGMDDRKHGEADLDDCVASKKMLAGLGDVDPAKIGIVGGSYGGYMVLAALAFRPREFAVGVDLYGVANWPRTLQSIPAWWESFRKALYREMGDPATDAEYLKRISPLFHAENIERPLIVLQGVNDPRVLKVESDEIVAAAKRRGTPVEYLLFPDEGHGITKKTNQVRGFKAILDFLDKYLKGGAPKA